MLSQSGEPVTQAELYMTLGTIYQQIGDLERADSLLDLSLEKRRALGNADDAGTAASLVALGELRVEQAELPDRALETHDGLARRR